MRTNTTWFDTDDPDHGDVAAPFQGCGGCATEAVQLPHHNGVALADVRHQVGESWTIISCSRHGVRKRLGHYRNVEVQSAR
jgi:hypothetical protein